MRQFHHFKALDTVSIFDTVMYPNAVGYQPIATHVTATHVINLGRSLFSN